MTRTIILVVALTSLGGFAAGWLVFDSRTGSTAAPSPTTTVAAAPRSGPVAIKHEFLLRPADVQADRETPAVAADSKGNVVLAWASQTGDLERTLYLARSVDGGTTFATPTAWRKVPIYRYASKSKGKEVTYSTHVLPRLAASGDALYVGWVEALEGGPTVAYYVARSTDGGRTFAEPIRAHGDDAVKPGFTTMTVGPDGSVECAWLDGRNKRPQPFASTWPADSEGFSPEQLVYAGPDGRGICPCCDLAAIRTPGERFLAFRNSADGNRDIWIASAGSVASGFQAPVPVTTDTWKFQGCPHDGPALVATGDRLHLVWMDGHTGTNRLYHASSPLDDLRFRPQPVTPGTTTTQGHPKLAAAGDGAWRAVWDEALDELPAAAPPQETKGHSHGHGAALTGSGRAIMYVDCQGDRLGTATAIAPRAGAFQLQPALAVGPDGTTFVAWNELDEGGKRIVFVRLSPAGAKP